MASQMHRPCIRIDVAIQVEGAREGQPLVFENLTTELLENCQYGNN